MSSSTTSPSSLSFRNNNSNGHTKGGGNSSAALVLLPKQQFTLTIILGTTLFVLRNLISTSTSSTSLPSLYSNGFGTAGSPALSSPFISSSFPQQQAYQWKTAIKRPSSSSSSSSLLNNVPWWEPQSSPLIKKTTNNTNIAPSGWWSRPSCEHNQADQKNNDDDVFQALWIAAGDDPRTLYATTSTTTAQSKNQNHNDSFYYYNTVVDWPFRTSPMNATHATDIRYVFVHVGKTGGMSLYNKLHVVDQYRILRCRINNTTKTVRRNSNDPCLPLQQKQRSPLLKQRVFGQLHKATAILQQSDEAWMHAHTNLILMTTRNPLDRVVSAFNFHRHAVFVGDPSDRAAPVTQFNNPANASVAARFFTECFANIRHLALTLDPRKRRPPPPPQHTPINNNNNNNTLPSSYNYYHLSPFCTELGVRIITGHLDVAGLEHLYYNYRHYATRAWTSGDVPSKPVVVVRTTNLWSDTNRLEGFMGGSPQRFVMSEVQDYRITHGSEQYEVNSGIYDDGNGEDEEDPEQASIALCCLLWDDIAVYTHVILSARNLDAMEKMQTLQPLWIQCGVAPSVAAASPLTWNDYVNWSWATWFQSACAPSSSKTAD